MPTKTKIFIGALVLVAFALGGFALNTYKAEALNAGKFFFHKFGINKEDWAAKKEEWKGMTPEEYKAKMEELKALKGEWKGEWEGEWKTEIKGFGFECPFWLFKKFGDEVNHEVITLDDGIQITITSDNSDIIQKLHGFVEKFNK